MYYRDKNEFETKFPWTNDIFTRCEHLILRFMLMNDFPGGLIRWQIRSRDSSNILTHELEKKIENISVASLFEPAVQRR